MGLGRVELPTSRLSGVRSNHLSYRPEAVRACRKACTEQTATPQGFVQKEKRGRRVPHKVVTEVRPCSEARPICRET